MDLKAEDPTVFELLDELMLKGRLDQKEQEALRFTAVLQISAHALQRPSLLPADHKLLALLLARWGFALTDKEQSICGLTEPYELSKASLARSLAADVDSVEEGLARLIAAKLIDAAPANSSDICAITLIPVLTELGEDLSQTLYREFLEREGYELASCAEFFLETIGDDIEQLSQDSALDSRVGVLAAEYEGFRRRTATRGHFVARWLDQPKAVYSWLSELAAFEEKHAILSGTPDTGLQTELAHRAGKKILILGCALVPPAAPANAA